MARSQKEIQVAKQNVFLKAYAQSGIIGEAARLAKIGRRTHYHWLADPEYQVLFNEATEAAADRLEAELIDRVYKGTPEILTWQGEVQYQRDEHGNLTDKPLMVRRKNDTLLIFALKAVRPDKYRDNFKGEISHTGTMTITRDAELSRLTDEQLAALEVITLAATATTKLQ